MVRRGENLQESQKNVNIIDRKLYYAKAGVLMGGEVLKWQNKCQ
jgi:hypothetical protein